MDIIIVQENRLSVWHNYHAHNKENIIPLSLPDKDIMFSWLIVIHYDLRGNKVMPFFCPNVVLMNISIKSRQ